MSSGPDKPISILVVDADVDDVAETRQSFELAGLPANLVVASSAEEALLGLRRIGPHASAARPDVLLVSFSLPGMSGIELLREIRSDAASKRLPVILFAGRASSKEEREEAMRLGADHVLDKPEHASELLGVVAAIKFFWMARAAASDPPPGPAGSLRPKRAADIDLMALPIEPREAYLLSAIDGERGPTALSEIVGASPKETRGMLKRLAELGAVEWQALHPSLAPPESPAAAPSLAPPQRAYIPRSPFSLMPGKPLGPRSAAIVPSLPELAALDVEPSTPVAPPPAEVVAILEAASPEVASPEAAPEVAPPELEPEPEPEPEKKTLDAASQLVIDQTHELLGESNHYELLGVATDATKADIRAAYYRLAKLFHPDTRYTWDLGPHQRKMERIFQALTDAYETLGKAKSRQAYDAYLGIVVETAPLERALSMPKVEAVKPTAAPAEAPAAMPVARSSRAEPAEPKAAPRSEPQQRAQTAVKHLARTLNQMSARTESTDRAARLIADAKSAEASGNLAGAASAMRIAAQWRPNDAELAREAERLAQAALEANVAAYEQRAKYEETRSMWKEAALSWSRVSKARPNDPKPSRRAAAMLLRGEGDLREAMRLARRATELDPKCVESRIVLSDIFLASGMMTSAKRQLEEALAIEPRHEGVKAKLGMMR